MYRIGLTGGIASGKSTVAKMLRNMGLPVINLDQISREVVAKDTPGYREVLKTFGQTILSPSGEIDRKALGRIIFENPVRRKELEAITHPLIIQEMEKRIQYLQKADKKVVVVEVPLLIEAGMIGEFDQIWLVYVSRELQLERLKIRDGLKKEEANLRLNAQMPLDEKKKYADKIIMNTGNLKDLQKQLDKLWRDISCEDWL